MSPVGGKLKQLREARGWSQSDLARLSRVDQGVISSLEAGEPGSQAGVLERLAAALGVSTSMLLSVAVPKPALPDKTAVKRKRK